MVVAAVGVFLSSLDVLENGDSCAVGDVVIEEVGRKDLGIRGFGFGLGLVLALGSSLCSNDPFPDAATVC